MKSKRRPRKTNRGCQHRQRLCLEQLEVRRVLDSTVVFNEIMYHPVGDDPAEEWIELHNQMSVDMDLSNWSLDNGIEFRFPDRVTVPGGGYVVVAKDPARLTAAGVTAPVFGPFSGRLSDGGEQIVLKNRSDRVMDTIDYSDEQPWPVGADGSGASLSKRDSRMGSVDPASWTVSSLMGGTPGGTNFQDFDPTPTVTRLVSRDATWRYDATGNDLGTAWRNPDFDDNGWEQGDAVLFAGAFQTIDLPDNTASGDLGASIILDNPSFEANTNGGVGYGSIDDWSGGSGVNPTSGGAAPFADNGSIPDDRRIAFIQGQGTLAQSVSGLDTDQDYWLQLYFNARGCCGAVPSIEVRYGNQQLINSSVVEPVGVGDYHFANIPFRPSRSSGRLEISNVGGGGDHTLLIDAVAIVPRDDQHVVIANPSFEATGPVAGVGFLSSENLAGWNYEGDGRIGVATQNGTLHDNGRVPDGNQVLMLQGLGSATQVVRDLTPGQRYELHYWVNSYAASAGPTLEVSVGDETVHQRQVPPVGQGNDYQGFTHRFTATSDTVDVRFELSSTPVADATLFVDNVSLRRVASPLVTELPEGATTYYFRKRFDFDGNVNQTDLHLQGFIDDAAVVYLNGEEVWRNNLPGGEIRFDTFASSPIGDPVDSEIVRISSESLRRGNNVMAVEVHQAAVNDVDMAFALDVVATEHPVDPNIQLASLAINEIGREGDELIVELTNRGSSTINTTGFQLGWSNGADAVGVPAMDLRAGQFLVVRTDAAAAGNGSAFLIDANQNAVNDAVSIKDPTQARLPDGNGPWFNVEASTFGRPNHVPLQDSVVISEIQYHPQPTYDVPETRREFELVPFIDQWRYRDDGADLGADWRQPDFNDATWSTGDAILYSGPVSVDFRNSPKGSVNAAPIVVANSGFEDGDLPPSPGYGPIEGWTGGDQTGANDRSGPFLSGLRIPEGKRVAFLHGQQQISQTLSGFEPGKSYIVQYLENERGEPANVASSFVTLGGQTIVDEHDVSEMNRFRRVVSRTFTATADTHVLTMGNARAITGVADDNALLLDAIAVTRAVPLISNGNFEQYGLPVRTAEEAPNGQPGVGWTFSGATGISRNGSAVQGLSLSSEGVQLGYLKGQSQIQQQVTGFEPGVRYSLSWSERKSTASPTANAMEIVLDAGLPTEKVLSAEHLVGTRTFDEQTSESFVADKTDYTLTLRTTNPNGDDDNTALVDDLRFNFAADTFNLATSLASTSTHYFRHEFQYDQELDAELQLNLLADDGAVVYLNGVEVYRENISAGPVDHSTRATQDRPQATFTGSVSLPSDSLRTGRNVLAIEMHQAPGSTDMAFGATLSGVITRTGTSFGENGDEWIEIYNRTDQPVDLTGWSLADAVRFEFEDGTTLGAGEFGVIARNETLFSLEHPDVPTLGSFDGRLADSQERIVLRDALDNPVDEVHYYDEGAWPEAADGGGASLELVSPNTDNSVPESWQASREVDSSRWNTYSYQAPGNEPEGAGVPRAFNELIIGLLDRGEVLLDDIRVIEDPQGAAIDLLPNGAFDGDVAGSDPQAWRLIGNHDSSHVVQDPDDPENNVLRLVATGPTEHMSNHGETTLANRAEIDEDKEYMISFRAKWISGSPQVNTRLYFNRAAETTVIETGAPSGTPGGPNSVWLDNVGPTFANLRHEPIVPTSDDTITVSVDAKDPDGVSTLQLHYSVDGGAMVDVAMTETAQGAFTAQIPSQSNGRDIQFYVSGFDNRGEAAQYPRLGPESRAVVRVTDRELPGDGPSIRIWMTPADVSHLHDNSNVMSNDRLGATIILDNSTIVYDAGVRLRASGFGRQGQLAGFNVEFPPDQLFRGVHETIALDRGTVLTDGGMVRGTPGASPHELLIYQIANHAGGIAGMYDDVIQVDAPRRANSGMALLKMARYTDTFLDSQFENGGDGSLFKYELIYHATTTVNGNPEGLKRAPNAVVGTDIKDLGTDEEAYRLNFILKNNRDRNDYSSIVDLGQAFSRSRSELDTATRDVMDVDQWMRTFALLSLVGVADVYNMGLAHNLELYVRPSDGNVLAFPWDVDHGFFYNVQSSILGRGGSNLHKIVNLPQNRRLFYKHLQDIVSTTYNLDYLASWARHYTEITGFDFADFFTDYVERRSAFVLSELDRVAPPVPFEIDKDIEPIVVDGLSATLTGQGWIDVHQIGLANQDEPLDVTWTDESQWQVVIPLAPGENTIQLQAFNYQGDPVGSDMIRAVSTVVERPLREFLRISELMYNPSDPTPAELMVNPNWESDDFEFVELVNTSTTTPLDLSQLQFTEGPSQVFGFGDSSIRTIDPGQIVLLVGNEAAFSARYGAGHPVAGEYSGNLRNSGESIRLEDTAEGIVLDFVYSDDDPWPVRADGDGASLELIDPSSVAPNQLSKSYSWRGSTPFGGTPGTPSLAPIGVVINEVLSNTDVAGDLDAIELLNTMDESIDIGGWMLTDAINQLKFQIPDGTTLGAGQYLVFDESHFNPTPNQPLDHHFALSGSRGDDVWLVTVDESGQLESFVDDVHFRAARPGESWSRFPNATGRLAPMARSLGTPNRIARVGPLFISQVHYHPTPPSAEALNVWPQLTTRELEFVEIHNPLDVDVELTDWRLRGGIEFDFPAGTRIDPGTSLVLVSFDPDDDANTQLRTAFLTEFGEAPQPLNLAGPYSGQLNNDGELLVLLRPDTPPVNDPTFVPRTVEDEVIFDDQLPWPTTADGGGSALHRGQVPGAGNLPTSWTNAPPLFASAVLGDLNNNGRTDVRDIDQFCRAVQQGDPRFDLNGDGTIGRIDLIAYVEQVLDTVFGDSNLDGTFDSSDLVQVFQSGQYEDDKVGNSTWASGDWDCDHEFSTSDLVLAFQRGGYVAGAQRSMSATIGAALGATTVRQHDVRALSADKPDVPMAVRRRDARRIAGRFCFPEVRLSETDPKRNCRRNR